jgi:hypothetical protein
MGNFPPPIHEYNKIYQKKKDKKIEAWGDRVEVG